MPRMLWFVFGMLAGTAYASSLIRTEGLDRARGEGALDVDDLASEGPIADARAMKEQLADRLEEGAIRVSGFLEEKAHDLAEALRRTAEPFDASATPAPQMPAKVGARMAAPPGRATSGGATAHEVLESPFPQVDPARPPAPILFDPTHKPPVMLDVTSDQGGMENFR